MASEPIKHCATCGREYHSVEDFFQETSRWRMCEGGHLWYNCACHSTGVIVKGKFAWYSPEKILRSGAAKSLFNQVSELKNLPSLPTVVMQLQQLLEQPGVNALELAQALKKAPMVAMNVVSLANDLKGLRSKGGYIESIEHAVSYIGLKMLKDVISAAAVRSISFKTYLFNYQEFWRRSYLSGRLSEHLARKFAPSENPDHAYLAGSLANIGKVVQAVCFPKDADRLHEAVKDPKKPQSWREAERCLGIHDHSILGEIAATMWGLPDHIVEAASLHHKQHLNQDVSPLVRVVSLANQMVHWIGLEPARIEQKVLKNSREYLAIEEQSLEAIASEFIEAA